MADDAPALLPRGTYTALRAGVLSAAWSVAGSYARGLLPRSAGDQAIATGAVAAFHLGTGTVAQATAEAIAEDLVVRIGRGSPQAIVLASTGIVAVASGAVLRAIPESRDHPLPVQIARAGALKLSGGAVAGAVVTASDMGMRRLGLPSRPVVNVLAAGAIGAAVATVSVWQRDRRAESMGIDGKSRKQVERPKGLKGAVAALGMGVAGAGGLLGVAGLEFVVAEGTTRLVTKVLRRDEEVTPLVGHAVALAGMTVAGGYALEQVRRRVQHQDDVVEPAYPEPPRSPYVSAGPRSEVSFHEIGKEGRRFVTMATTAEQVSAVMGEPAVDPVRVVAGYESSREIAERAALAVNELDRLGGFERKAILVAAPTGVGYVNYVVIEALEYLMRGDVATVVPQYALLPSALALDSTKEAVELQRLVLEGISRRLATMPDARRPSLWQFGESLGAQVALDVVGDATTAKLLELGVERGLYLGVPFRSRTWERWFERQGQVDPGKLLTLVSEPDDVDAATAAVRHLMVVHHDDPVNMFSYDAVVRPPWWLGEPETRPPLVPRETRYRPVTTFVLMLVDLKNGMNSKPGAFVRRGHDYRIDARAALELAFGLRTTPEQAEAIEAQIRRSETDWAARRLVARKFARARNSVLSQLQSWGVDPADLDLDAITAGQLAEGKVSSFSFARHLGTSG